MKNESDELLDSNSKRAGYPFNPPHHYVPQMVLQLLEKEEDPISDAHHTLREHK